MNNDCSNPFLNNCHSNCCRPRNCCCNNITPFPGPRGPQGPAGTPATIAIGTTTTGEPGTNAIVTNTGTSSNAVLNFIVPRGDAATITVGNTTTLPAGSPATVTNSGTESNVILNFGIPSGTNSQAELISGSFISRTTQTFTSTNSIIQLPITLNSSGISINSNSVITIPKTGRYMINYGIKSTTISNTIGVYINGVNNTNTNLETLISDLNPTSSIILQLNSGDTLTLGVVNATTANSLALQNSTINAYMTIISLD